MLLIEEINIGTLDRYVNRRRARAKAYSTINREISVLRHALRLAARWKIGDEPDAATGSRTGRRCARPRAHASPSSSPAEQVAA